MTSRLYSFCSCVLLPLLVTFSTMSYAADPPGIPDGWSDGYAYVNGARLHYYHAVAAPEKPVIVMVHGVTDIGLNWTTLTEKLQDEYDIYMLDTRSHGLSDPIKVNDDGDTLVKDVVEFAKVMEFDKPLLMGHSLGGATVIRVAAEYPDLAKAVIVLDAGIGGPGGGGRAGSRRGPPPGAREERRPAPSAPPASQSNESSASDNLSINMFDSPEVLVTQNNYRFEDLVETGERQHPKWSLTDVQYWALSKKQYHGAYSPEMFAVMSGAMQTGDSLANIPVPVLILKADAPPASREAHQAVVSEMPNVTLVHIDDAGHNLHHDQLDRTVEVLSKFLATLSE